MRPVLASFLYKGFNFAVLNSLGKDGGGGRRSVKKRTKKLEKKEKLIRVLMTQVSNLSRFVLNSQFANKMWKVKNLIVTEKQKISHNSFCTCNSRANLRYRNFLNRNQKEPKIINISHYHDQKIIWQVKKIYKETVLSIEELQWGDGGNLKASITNERQAKTEFRGDSLF